MDQQPQLHRETLRALSDVARLLNTYIDRRAAESGVTRAQWGALRRIGLYDGLTQAEIAEQMDLQPISLLPILDRLCDQGMIERRAHPADRRAKQLFLTDAARALLKSLDPVAQSIYSSVFAGFADDDATQLLEQLMQLKDNIKRAANTVAAPLPDRL